jgi:hypothetical protein
MHKRYAMLKTSLDLAKVEKSNVDSLLASAELQNITLRDRVQELKGMEPRMEDRNIDWRFSAAPSLNRWEPAIPGSHPDRES